MKHTFIALIMLACSGCASEWRCVLHGERFLLTSDEPRYRRLDVTLLSVEPDGSARVRWNKSGHVSTVVVDQAVTGTETDSGFVRLLASHFRAKVAVFETMWSTR